MAAAVQDRDTVRAQARYVRCSARKARLVLEHIRGKQAADAAPTLTRWRPRARGRVNRIRKRTCHITIQLAVAEPGEIKKPVRRRPAAAPKAQPAPETA